MRRQRPPRAPAVWMARRCGCELECCHKPRDLMEVVEWCDLLSWLALTVTLAVAMFPLNGPSGLRPLGNHPETDFQRHLDELFRTCGSLLALLLILLRLYLVPHNFSVFALGSREHLLARLVPIVKGNRTQTIMLWAAIGLSRLLIYFFIRPVHYHFSDHIFLVTSLMAMISCELAQMRYGWSDTKEMRWCVGVVLICAMIFNALLCYEAWTTARYYHTRFATWAAFVTGFLLYFCGFRILLVQYICNPRGQKQGTNLKEPILSAT